MIFILIGPDMAGKTTLATSLGKRFGTLMEYRKFSHYPTPEESVEAAERTVKTLLKSSGNDKVYLFDRFHFPDDLVYGPATKRYEIDYDIRHRYIGTVLPSLLKLQTAYIYCHAPIEVLEHRFKMRGDDYIIPEYLPEILRRYQEFIYGSHFVGLPTLQLDSGRLDQAEMLHTAAEFIRYQIIKFKGVK